MVCIRIIVICFCRTDIDSCESRSPALRAATRVSQPSARRRGPSCEATRPQPVTSARPFQRLRGLSAISRKSWLFLVLSGLATGASWLCYYRALQIGEASKVVPIDKLSVVITLVLAFVFLHEQVTGKSIIGCILIGAGTLLMVL